MLLPWIYNIYHPNISDNFCIVQLPMMTVAVNVIKNVIPTILFQMCLYWRECVTGRVMARSPRLSWPGDPGCHGQKSQAVSWPGVLSRVMARSRRPCHGQESQVVSWPGVYGAKTDWHAGGAAARRVCGSHMGDAGPDTAALHPPLAGAGHWRDLMLPWAPLRSHAVGLVLGVVSTSC